MSRLFIISSVAIAVIGLLARGKYDMTISYVLPSRKYDMAHINLNSPRKQSLSVDIGKLLPGLGMGNCNTYYIINAFMYMHSTNTPTTPTPPPLPIRSLYNSSTYVLCIKN